MHVSKSSPARAAIAHRSITDEQESTATWPTLASRKHSLLGLDSTETDDGEYGGKHRQESAESTHISRRFAAARALYRIAFLRFSRTYGAISPSLEVVRTREKEAKRTAGIWDRLRSLWRSWLVADFYRVQLPILLCSLVLWSLSFLVRSRETSSSFPVSHSPANQERLQHYPERTPSVLTQHQDTSRTLARGWIERISASSQLDKIIDFFYSSPPKSKIQRNAEAVVWADTRTGLYYCPGEKPPGHKQKGQHMSQQQAQRLSFEPANRRPCQ